MFCPEMHRFIAFDRMFNWKAIAAFDTRFRLEKASSRPGSISSWKDPAVELTRTFFTFNPAAAKHPSTGGCEMEEDDADVAGTNSGSDSEDLTSDSSDDE